MARQLTVELVGQAVDFARTLRDASNETATFGEKMAATGKKMTAFVSVPIIGFLGTATKMAMDDAAAQDHLAKTLENTVGATGKVVAQVEEQIGAFMKVSTFTDDELRPAYEALARTTLSVEDSTRLMSVAMDVAAGKSIPLETATLAVTKANEGQFAAVNKLVPGLLDLSDKTLTAESATAKLAAMFSGQAAEATETAAGKAQNLKRDMGELTESLGAKLQEPMGKVIGLLGGVVEKITSMPEPAQNALLIFLGVAAVSGPVVTIISNLAKAITAVKTAVIATNTALTGSALARLIGIGGATVVGGGALGNLAADKLGLSEIKNDFSGGILGDFSDQLGRIIGFIPGFATGGIVPGPVGSPQLVLAHGGEAITPPGAGNQSINVALRVELDGRQIQESLLRLQRTSGNLGIVGA